GRRLDLEGDLGLVVRVGGKGGREGQGHRQGGEQEAGAHDKRVRVRRATAFEQTTPGGGPQVDSWERRLTTEAQRHREDRKTISRQGSSPVLVFRSVFRSSLCLCASVVNLGASRRERDVVLV